MKAQIFADDRSQLAPIAREAIQYLANEGAPGSQTRATEFNHGDDIGHSDAG